MVQHEHSDLGLHPDRIGCQCGDELSRAKDTTFNGIECLTWEEVFDRCTDGFESENRLALANDVGDDVDAWIFSTYLSHMLPDRLGIRENLSPEASIDDFQVSRGECRMPSLREAWYKSAIRAENSWDDEFMPAELVKSGPFCFVDATDPRASTSRERTGGIGGTRSAGHCESRLSWGHPVPCGVPRCSLTWSITSRRSAREGLRSTAARRELGCCWRTGSSSCGRGERTATESSGKCLCRGTLQTHGRR